MHAIDNEGKTVLIRAVMAGNEVLVAALLEAGAKLSTYDYQQRCALDYAAMRDDTHMLRYLVEQVGVDVHRVNPATKLNALAHAMRAGRLEACQYLIEQGCEVGATWGAHQGSIIAQAVSSGNVELVQYLSALGMGWAVDIQGEVKRASLVNRVILAGHLEMLLYLEKQGFEVQTLYPLHKACRSARLEMLQYILTRGANINELDRDGESPLQCAISLGHQEMAEYLIKQGAKLSTLHEDEAALFIRAVESGSAELANYLLLLLVERGHQREQLLTHCLYALVAEEESAYHYLISRGADILARDEGGNSLLHRAIIEDDPQNIAYFCKQGLDVNMQNPKGDTPLHLAVREHSYKAGLKLIHLQASFHLVNKQGETPITLALSSADNPFHKLFQKHLDNSLYYETRDHNITAVQELIAQGANPNANYCDTGCNALSVAAQEGVPELARCLVAAGADVNGDGMRETPLAIAAGQGHLGMLQCLLELGAHLEARGPRVYDDASTTQRKRPIGRENHGYHTALEAAAGSAFLSAQHLACAHYLLDKGAKVYKNSLHHAIQSEDLELVQRFVEAGAAVYKNSSLHAVETSTCAILKYLIKNGASPHAHPNPVEQAAHVKTLLEMATKLEDGEMVEYLRGKDLNHANKTSTPNKHKT